jgi:hypothetical protein
VISEKLKGVILRELDLEDYPITEDTLASEVPGWDSLSHIRVRRSLQEPRGHAIEERRGTRRARAAKGGWVSVMMLLETVGEAAHKASHQHVLAWSSVGLGEARGPP